MDILSYLLGKKAGGGSSVNLQDKNITVTTNGSQNITADSGYDGLREVSLTTNVVPNNQSKSLTITENTTTIISPDTGYDGLSQVEITTNVSGGDLSEYINTDGFTARDMYMVYYSQNMGQWYKSIKKISKLDMPLNTTKIAGFFQNFQGTTLDVSNWNTQNITDISFLFNGCSNLLNVDLSNFNTENVNNMRGMFGNCKSLTSLDLSNFDTNNVTDMTNMFSACSNLQSLDLSNFVSTKVTTINSMFLNCTNLAKIDIRKFEFSNISDIYNSFAYVPTNCLIIVKDQTQKDWFTTNYPTMTNVKTVAEYEAS